MVISVNPDPNRQEFETLLNQTLSSLIEESKIKKTEYLSLLGNKLEKKVFDTLCSNAQNTPFDGSIELISGQKFPDIIANKFYGVEVKTTKSNHWKSIGSSVAEGTRVEGIERIFMLFGKMCSPINFICRPYEACLSEVVVTHSPRYQIDMELKAGETIFDKIKVPYDDLRKQVNPIKTILDYYKSKLQDGESTWWSGDVEKGNNMIVRLWNTLDLKERHNLIIKGFCLFPELLCKSGNKYSRFALWLTTSESIICTNIRDLYTSGGQGTVKFEGKTYNYIPKIIVNLLSSLNEIKKSLNDIEKDELSGFWRQTVDETKLYEQWCDLIIPYAKEIIPNKFPFERYIKNHL